MPNIKKEVIQLCKKLEGIVPEKRKDFDEIITLLEKKDPINPSKEYAVIPENEEGKREACEFIRFLFCENPELMTPPNKKLVEKFHENVSVSPHPRKTLW